MRLCQEKIKNMLLRISPSLFAQTPNTPSLFRNQRLVSQKKCRIEQKPMTCTSHISSKGQGLVLFGTLTPSLLIAVPSSAEEELKMATFVDEINAYTYSYPVELPSTKFLFKWVESRQPEHYSSAAPLVPDARLRIVSERVDIIDNLIISVAFFDSVGPPNFQVIISKDKNSWTAKDIANAVLADKSALGCNRPHTLVFRLPRLMVNHTGTMSILRKSPTRIAQEPNLYCHYVASTAERDGYLYSFSASTLSKQWDKALSSSTLHK